MYPPFLSSSSLKKEQVKKMVERRRKPLILCSTKSAINSVLKSSNSSINENEFPNFNLPVGILRFSNNFPSFDHSALIALSTSLLKTLSITSGSPVIHSNNTLFSKFSIFVTLVNHHFSHQNCSD